MTPEKYIFTVFISLLALISVVLGGISVICIGRCATCGKQLIRLRDKYERTPDKNFVYHKKCGFHC